MNKKLVSVLATTSFLTACGTIGNPPPVFPEYGNNGSKHYSENMSVDEVIGGAKTIMDSMTQLYYGCSSRTVHDSRKASATGEKTQNGDFLNKTYRCLNDPAVYDDAIILLSMATAGLFIFDGSGSADLKKSFALAAGGVTAYRTYLKPFERQGVAVDSINALTCFIGEATNIKKYDDQIKMKRNLMGLSVEIGGLKQTSHPEKTIKGSEYTDNILLAQLALINAAPFLEQDKTIKKLSELLNKTLENTKKAKSLSDQRYRSMETIGPSLHKSLIKYSTQLFKKMRSEKVDYTDSTQKLVDIVKANAKIEQSVDTSEEAAKIQDAQSEIMADPTVLSDNEQPATPALEGLKSKDVQQDKKKENKLESYLDQFDAYFIGRDLKVTIFPEEALSLKSLREEDTEKKAKATPPKLSAMQKEAIANSLAASIRKLAHTINQLNAMPPVEKSVQNIQECLIVG